MTVFKSAFAILLFIGSKGKNIEPTPYAKIPKSIRAELITKIIQLLETEKRGDWAAAYEFLSPRNRTITKDQFVRDHKSATKVLGFEPLGTSELWSTPDDKVWVISGCLKLKEDWPRRSLEGAVEAEYYQGKWYLSGFDVVTPEIDSDPTPCRYHEPKH